MKALAFLLNLPWTIVGIMCGLISIPQTTSFNLQPPALVMSVRSFWWYWWLPNMKGARAMAIGNVVLLGRNILDKDLEHELIHVEQVMRTPLIHPILYWIETLRKGYGHNKYEEEAYGKAGNLYIEK